MAEEIKKRGSKIQTEVEKALEMPVYKWCEINCIGMSRHEACDALETELVNKGIKKIPGPSSLWNFIKLAQSNGLTTYNFIGKKGRRKKSDLIVKPVVKKIKKPAISETVENETIEEKKEAIIPKSPVINKGDENKMIEVSFVHRDNPEIFLSEEISLSDLKDQNSRIVTCRSYGDGYNPIYVAKFEIDGEIYRRAMVKLPTSGIEVESFVDENLRAIRNPFIANIGPQKMAADEIIDVVEICEDTYEDSEITAEEITLETEEA